MQTVHGLLNGNTIQLYETPSVEAEGEVYVLVTFLEGSLMTAAAREYRLGHMEDPLHPPHVYQEDLKRQMATQYRRFTVGAVMTRNVVTIPGNATVMGALRLMRQRGTSSILVEPQNGQQWGIMTMRDLLRHIVVPSRSPKDVHVQEIATTNLIRATPDMTLRECARMMIEANVRRVVIYEDDKPVGIVSDTDIFQFVEEHGWEAETE
jgi:isocitrate dehydrogenase